MKQLGLSLLLLAGVYLIALSLRFEQYHLIEDGFGGTFLALYTELSNRNKND